LLKSQKSVNWRSDKYPGFFLHNSYLPEKQVVIMEEQDEQDLQVKKDLAHLSRTLTSENLNPDVMFARKRGIRSCAPALGLHGNGTVSERLKRVQLPEE
jgi:hypothetical protein